MTNDTGATPPSPNEIVEPELTEATATIPAHKCVGVWQWHGKVWTNEVECSTCGKRWEPRS